MAARSFAVAVLRSGARPAAAAAAAPAARAAAAPAAAAAAAAAVRPAAAAAARREFSVAAAYAAATSARAAAAASGAAGKSVEEQIEADIKAAIADREAEAKAAAAEQARGVLRPSVKLHGLSANYAQALFEACAADGTLQLAEQNLAKFAEIMHSDDMHEELFINPAISDDERRPILQALVNKSADGDAKKLAPSVASLFATLLENRRLDQWEAIYKDFTTLVKSTRSEIDATLTVAGPIYAADVSKIADYVGDYVVGQGAKVNLTVKLDEALLGGFVLTFGDSIIDMSEKLARNAFRDSVSAEMDRAFAERQSRVLSEIAAI